MIPFFKKLFGRPPQKITKEFVSQFPTGTLIELVYKDPRTLGFSTPNNLALTRFNLDELDNRVIQGTLTRNFYEPKPLDEQILEVTSIKPNGSVRKFMILSHEIESIKKMK